MVKTPKKITHLLIQNTTIMTATPVTKTTEGEVDDVYFDLTILIDRQNEVSVLDNTKVDWHDSVDCDTLVAHQVKVSVI